MVPVLPSGSITPREARLLIVDDQEANVRLLRRALEVTGGYVIVESTTDPRRVPELWRAFRPDLIFLDLHMPEIDGYRVLEDLVELGARDAFVPVVVLTADVVPDARRRALELGASEFLTKPFDPLEVKLRVDNLLAMRALHLQALEHGRTLESEVRDRTHELERAQIEMLERLALAAEYRDDETGEHTRRVGDGAAIVARALGLPDDEVQAIRRAARLHDVGKIGVPDEILLKPGKLDPDEFEVIKRHTLIGAEILSGGTTRLLQNAEEIALSHHERWDGRGYPHGLAGAAIPLSGRIVAVIDVFDALTHDRPYKEAWGVERAVAEILGLAGKQFDPEVVRAFGGVAKGLPL